MNVVLRGVRGVGLFLYGVLLVFATASGLLDVATWAEDRFGVPPWPFVVLLGGCALAVFLVEWPTSLFVGLLAPPFGVLVADLVLWGFWKRRG